MITTFTFSQGYLNHPNVVSFWKRVHHHRVSVEAYQHFDRDIFWFVLCEVSPFELASVVLFLSTQDVIV